MSKKILEAGGATLALVALSLVGVAVAVGATKKPVHTLAHTPEAALTGDALAKVTAAAVAKAGGTVDSATIENDSTNTAAKYEAHVTKADGTHVTVILDSSYAVLSVETGGPGGHGGGPGGHGGPGNGETPLTGTAATQAKAAAVASAGGTADLAMTETDSSNTAAKYEVHVTKADGTHVVVILDASFNVLSTEADMHGGPGGGHGH